MGATFVQPIKLVPPEGTPRELDNFLFRHGAMPDPGTVIVGYRLEGDYPVGLSVDELGNISGRIEHFGNQPSCQDDNEPKEKPLINGSNWHKNGRYRPSFYTFIFDIIVTWKENEADLIEFTTSKKCSITVNKDNSIDNLIYFTEYSKYYEMDPDFDVNKTL